jgi:cell division protein FtsX
MSSMSSVTSVSSVTANVISALRRTARIATRRPSTALWTLAALACALFVVGIAAVTAETVERWAAAHPGTSGAMVVYLGEGVDDVRAQAVVGALRGLRGVERAELVPAAESARRLTRALGTEPGLLDGVEPASLPASVEVTLAPGVRDVAALSPAVQALRASPGVADVVIERGDGDGREDRIADALSAARTAASTGAAVFAALALVIVLAAVRVRLDRPAREAAVLELLGAPAGFVAIPTALAGALLGALAALVAAVALGAVVHGTGGQVGSVALAAPSAGALVGLVGLGGLVGLVGGGLAGVARAP